MGRTTVHLQADLNSVRPCRRRAAEFAAGLGASGRTEQVVELLTSELVTNAVKYGAPDLGIDLELRHVDGSVRVEVTDRGDRLPTVLRDVPSSGPGGRGMHLVEKLSDAWGVVPHPDGGKTVWFAVLLGGMS